MHEIVRKIIPIQVAGSADGLRHGGVDTIRGSFSTSRCLTGAADGIVSSTHFLNARMFGQHENARSIPATSA